ncbi:oxidoreductase [Alisedimentitalea sp. MJ-SS2]|uniref:oxidoreductase n=1 Tax=Aliisedimentitalea sp. MJ-SS2 TaxID=3049795 RepID=UPI002912490A|nr:oxidoreductase [Alisedimentitalea sp. MJ-SS2]MDU8929295.1 oxidoreductase [Alisedimentitalea sp. MJ-SS2]
MTKQQNDTATLLGRPLALPCGAQLKNRLIKAAMSDSLGDGEGNATDAQARLYERWAQGGAALSIIGEVQISPHFPEKPGNLVLGPDADMNALKSLTRRGAVNGAQIWPQLGHAGALSHQPISHPKGPSPLNVDGLTCEGMTRADIDALPAAYARAATMAKDAGFGGVQIHAGHGFLFSQFLSPLFNHRSDAYGGTVAGRFRVIGATIDAVRRAGGPAFPIGIRINATDKLVGGLTEEDALEVVHLLNKTSVDLIDISGGTYFPGAASSSDGAASGPYFLDFAKRAKAITSIPIMLTGGFKTRDQAASAIRNGGADAIGLARPMVLNPSLAITWLGDSGGDPVFPRFSETPPGGVTAWYSMRLTALGHDTEDTFDLSLADALAAYDSRDAERCIRWQKRFT